MTSKTECVQGEQRQQKMTPVTLQASKNFFLWVQTAHTEYPRCRPEPGKCSAH